MKLDNRSIHRDLAYFYVGLILAFSFSGIILNHRRVWYPMDYVYESKEVSLEKSRLSATMSEEEVKSLVSSLDLEYDSHRVRDNNLRVDFKDEGILNVNMESGDATLEYRRLTPLLGHTMYLHKTTNNFWIWYSDIFGLAMIVIAITGMFISKGKFSFSKRGWKLMAAGLVFPIIILIVFG